MSLVAQDTFVFVGPTLDVATAQTVLPAQYLPPAKQGDCYRLLGRHPSRVVLIDGVFHREPSVWPRELLALLDAGVHVYGCSSMGALRAVELAPFGMIGVGAVFEWYRNGSIEADDEVALHHGDASSGYRALSEPLVNIRATLQRAVEDGIVDAHEAEALVGHARSLHYSERSLAAVAAAGVALDGQERRRERLREFFATCRVDIKRRDALDLLRRLGQENLAGKTCRPRRSGPLSEYVSRGIATEEQLVDRRSRTDWSRRWFVLQWATERRLLCPESWAAVEERRWLRNTNASSLAELAKRCQLTVAEVAQVMRDEAQLSWLLSHVSDTRDHAIAVSDDESLFAWDETRLARSAPYIADWARNHGISHGAADAGALVDWMVQQGPEYFGFEGARVLSSRILYERLSRAAAASLA